MKRLKLNHDPTTVVDFYEIIETTCTMKWWGHHNSWMPEYGCSMRSCRTEWHEYIDCGNDFYMNNDVEDCPCLMAFNKLSKSEATIQCRRKIF